MLRTLTLLGLLALASACEIPTDTDDSDHEPTPPRVHVAHASPAIGSVTVTLPGGHAGALAPFDALVREVSEPGTVTVDHGTGELSTTLAAEPATAYAVILMAYAAPRMERYQHRTFSLTRLTVINAVPAPLTVEVSRGGSRSQADLPFAGSVRTDVGTGEVEVRVVREDGSSDPIGSVHVSDSPRFLVVAPGANGEEFVLMTP